MNRRQRKKIATYACPSCRSREVLIAHKEVRRKWTSRVVRCFSCGREFDTANAESEVSE